MTDRTMIRHNNDPFPGQDSHPLPDGWQRDIEYAVRGDLGDGAFWYSSPFYRREHAERESRKTPGSTVVSRQMHVGQWTAGDSKSDPCG